MNPTSSSCLTSPASIRTLAALVSLSLGALTMASQVVPASLLHSATVASMPQDLDADGWSPPQDCDDFNFQVHPGAQEILDGIDNDCDGQVDEGFSVDADQDGWTSPDDCDDTNPNVYPGATEVQDGLDNDCNGLIDDLPDSDGDGSNDALDCEPFNPNIYPGAVEIFDGIDNNCDGNIDEGLDLDGDGYPAGPDCNDSDPLISPDAEEFEDGIDNNCNGIIDDWWDLDGDGYIAFSDCNDQDPLINPGATEVCDGVDNDCDGVIDGPCAEGACYDPNACDGDRDGYPDAQDCGPDDSQTYPGAREWCDGKDNDCDGSVDEACTVDCDGNFVPDADEIDEYSWLDLDQNGVLDACQIRDDPSLDCNQNQILDSFEIANDWYFPVTDCNENGRIDSCEIEDDPSLDCNGNSLFDLCEIVYGLAEDCDQNGVPDSCAQYGGVDISSDRLTPFGYTSPQTWTIDPAFPGIDGAFSTARLTMRVRGDFAGPGEYFTVYLNGRFAGNVAGGGIYDCNAGPLSTSDFFTRELEIPINVWNYAAAAGGGVVAIDFVPSIAVDANRCTQPKTSFIEADLVYTAALDADCNANGLLDICEIEIAPWIDMNSNGIPDECEGNGTISTGCPGDLDRSGQVDPGDIALLLLEMNTPAAPGDPLDVDQSGMVDPGDVGFMLLLFGPCS